MRGYAIRQLGPDDLDYIWDHMREYDQRELVLQHYDREAVKRHLYHPVSLCGVRDGVPFVAFGAVQYGTCVFVWLFGTDRLDASWKVVHRMATAFLSQLVSKYWGLSICVQVWEGHRQSRTWLRRLGFRDTPHVVEVEGERLRVMEYRGQN